MKAPRLQLIALIAVLPLGLALTRAGDEVTFAVEEGTLLSKELTVHGEFQADGMTVSVNGTELPTGGDLSAAVASMDAVIRVTDEYLEVEAGRPLQLLRTFEELALSYETPEDGGEVDEFEALVDSTVSFDWGEDEGGYLVSFHESEGDEALLEQLKEDMDLRALLPEGPVSTGDSWEAASEGIPTLFLPGGVVGIEDSGETTEEGAQFEQILESIDADIDEILDAFTVTCTYKGSREEEGLMVGEIEFEVEGEFSIDLGEALREIADLGGGGLEVEEAFADLSLELQASGVLLWDLAGGHAHFMEMSSEMSLLLDAEAVASTEGMDIAVSLVAEGTGRADWTMSVTRE